MTETINSIQDQIIEDFASFSSWEEKYKHLISLGKQLPAMRPEDKTESLKVKGCQSQVWLKAHINEKGEAFFEADSDALIVRGLVALLLKVYNYQSPKAILETPLYFIEKIQLAQHLSASRTNGLNSMIKQIIYYAQAFSLLSRS